MENKNCDSCNKEYNLKELITFNKNHEICPKCDLAYNDYELCQLVKENKSGL